MNKNIPVVGIIILFVLTALAPITFGSNINNLEEQPAIENYNFNRYLYPEYYNCYNADEIPENIRPIIYEAEENQDIPETENIVDSKNSPKSLSGLMDSSWPMYCHDVRHTGRSPYSTVDTWDEIWKFETRGWADGGPAIDENGTIYIGSYRLYAVYPNGTLKWDYIPSGAIESCPAIGDDGIIYFGTAHGAPDYLYALYLDGTEKWKYYTGDDVFSSPAIGSDGTIYFGDSANWKIRALYPNGTSKWSFQANHVVYSSPAIGEDGTVYCGSHDTYLYALYPNNGTLKWKYKTGHWIRTAPCISDDGTIYVVSLDNHLYAVNPNGSLKWKTNMGEGGTSPTIGHDGTIYAGYKILHAINPNNGSVKWTFKVGGKMMGGTPCNSIDGTIYVGTGDNGQIVAINHDGTERWRKKIGKYIDSPPAISEDGTVYIGSSQAPGEGYLHAFSIGPLEADADGPYYGLVDIPVQFEGYSKGGYSPHSYHWDFGDGQTADEQNPSHIYTNPGNYTVALTVTDDSGNSTNDNTWAWIQDGNTPPIQPSIDGPTHGSVGTSYDYTFTSSDPEGLHIWYYIDWGDGSNTGWIGPYGSGIGVTKSHTWSNRGTYTIKCIARDPYNDEGQEGILTVTMPRNKMMYNSLFLRLLERFSLLERLLSIIGWNMV